MMMVSSWDRARFSRGFVVTGARGSDWIAASLVLVDIVSDSRDRYDTGSPKIHERNSEIHEKKVEIHERNLEYMRGTFKYTRKIFKYMRDTFKYTREISKYIEGISTYMTADRNTSNLRGNT